MVKTRHLGLGVVTLALIALVSVGCTPGTAATNTNSNSAPAKSDGAVTGDVKEFTMTSFYEMVDGQPKPQFSIKDITVNKGHKVRIKVTNTNGNHNFNLDE